jgi:putative chitinase
MDKKKFYDDLRENLFTKGLSQQQVDGIEAILDAWEKWAPDSDHRFIAYALATALWETAFTMQPIGEYGKGRGRAYGSPTGKFKKIYYGRGYVQLTWIRNYLLADKKLKELGVLKPEESLVANPELALRPDIAAAIMVRGMVEGWFTGKKLSHYFKGNISHWLDARRIINGTDRASKIASYAMIFYNAFEEAKLNK